MSDRVRLTWWRDERFGGSAVMSRDQAYRLLGCAQLGAWADCRFRIEPHEERSMETLLVILLWVRNKGLAFAVARWELIALAIMLVALAVVYLFTPKWERPILIGLPLCSLALGAVLAYKYLTKSLP